MPEAVIVDAARSPIGRAFKGSLAQLRPDETATYVVDRLLEREGTIYVLVREGSRGRLEELRSRWGAEEARIVPVIGDLSQENLGVDQATIDELVDGALNRLEQPPQANQGWTATRVWKVLSRQGAFGRS